MPPGPAAPLDARGPDPYLPVVTDDRPLEPLLRPRVNHRPWWKRCLLAGLGVVLLLLGMVGWLLPVVTGIPFYLAGFVVLAMTSDRVREMINRLDARLPERRRRGVRRVLRRIPGVRRLLVESAPPDGTGNSVRSGTADAELRG